MPTLRTVETNMAQNDEALKLNLDLLEEKREQAAIREARSKAKNNDANHTKDGGKLGPKWEGPYQVTKALGRGAYKGTSMESSCRELGTSATSRNAIFMKGARRCISWRQFILALGLHTSKEIDTIGFGAYWSESARQIPDKGDLSAYWIWISYAGDFLGTAPSYTLIRDPMLRLCHRLIACSIARRRKKHGVMISGAAKDVPGVNEGAQADPAPVQATQQPPPHPAASRTMPYRLGRLEEEMQGLRQDVRSLRGIIERLLADQGRFSTWMISCMAQLMEDSGQTYQAFDGTFRGSSPVVFERRTRQRTGEASTSTA
ncbi:hypothetical protein Tco_0824436 [Tanacetum coccineum]|uniref:Reverse transcriptase domain-containing protein n=1 Tax=Tanacetum coccineum TaxID=301880 RepID=A0ABQ5AP52_9ASTR